jgi:hypothetical protein
MRRADSCGGSAPRQVEFASPGGFPNTAAARLLMKSHAPLPRRMVQASGVPDSETRNECAESASVLTITHNYASAAGAGASRSLLPRDAYPRFCCDPTLAVSSL